MNPVLQQLFSFMHAYGLYVGIPALAISFLIRDSGKRRWLQYIALGGFAVYYGGKFALTPPTIQQLFSFMVVCGLGSGIAALIMSSLAAHFKHRRQLLLFALGGFAMFTWGMLALTPSGFRLHNIYFWLFTLAVVGGAIGCVTMRNVFHSALMLILTLFGIAGYFILVNAEFLAAVQVIIYIGGIMVLFLIGIMVSQNIIGTEITQNTPETPWAAVAAGFLFLFMAFTGLTMTLGPSQFSNFNVLENNTQSIGWSLMATYTLPFEVASLLLLMAMMGAIILTRKD